MIGPEAGMRIEQPASEPREIPHSPAASAAATRLTIRPAQPDTT